MMVVISRLRYMGCLITLGGTNGCRSQAGIGKGVPQTDRCRRGRYRSPIGCMGGGLSIYDPPPRGPAKIRGQDKVKSEYGILQCREPPIDPLARKTWAIAHRKAQLSERRLPGECHGQDDGAEQGRRGLQDIDHHWVASLGWSCLWLWWSWASAVAAPATRRLV